MTVTRRITTIVLAAVAAVALALPGHASGRPSPPDGPVGAHPRRSTPQTPVASRPPAAAPSEQFWGEATWLNPLSGLNLDRSSVGG